MTPTQAENLLESQPEGTILHSTPSPALVRDEFFCAVYVKVRDRWFNIERDLVGGPYGHESCIMATHVLTYNTSPGRYFIWALA